MFLNGKDFDWKWKIEKQTMKRWKSAEKVLIKYSHNLWIPNKYLYSTYVIISSLNIYHNITEQ